MKISLEDYKTAELKVNIDGVDGVIVVHSLASRAWKEGLSKYQAAVKYAEENKIDMEIETVIDAGFEHEGEAVTSTKTERSDFALNAWASCISSLVKEWPFDIDLLNAVKESDELMGQIDILASSLGAEFTAKKKT